MEVFAITGAQERITPDLHAAFPSDQVSVLEELTNKIDHAGSPTKAYQLMEQRRILRDMMAYKRSIAQNSINWSVREEQERLKEHQMNQNHGRLKRRAQFAINM